MENEWSSWTASHNISSMSFQRGVREAEINLNTDLYLVLLLYLGNGE